MRKVGKPAIIVSVAAAVILTVLLLNAKFLSVVLKPNLRCREVCPGVIDLGTYTELNYEFAEKIIEAAKTLSKGGGCSAAVKEMDNGDIVAGRNLDLYICNYPVYVMHTKLDGLYETIGSTMMYDRPFPEYDKAMKKGISNVAYQVLPFVMLDVMNSEGFYMEINMRHGETDGNGQKLFRSDGTNPGEEHRVLATSILPYVASHCATVEDALRYIETLDIYSDPAEDAWGYGFLMADATGRHGILEIADNGFYWTEGQDLHTNFYIAEELLEKQRYQIGLGRYEVLSAGLNMVHTEEDLSALLDSVSYRQVSSQHCQFDNRTEFTGTRPEWTCAYTLDPAHADEIREQEMKAEKKLTGTPREQMKTDDDIWETTYRNVANLSKKTMTYRFFEEDPLAFTLQFGN